MNQLSPVKDVFNLLELHGNCFEVFERELDQYLKEENKPAAELVNVCKGKSVHCPATSFAYLYGIDFVELLHKHGASMNYKWACLRKAPSESDAGRILSNIEKTNIPSLLKLWGDAQFLSDFADQQTIGGSICKIAPDHLHGDRELRMLLEMGCNPKDTPYILGKTKTIDQIDLFLQYGANAEEYLKLATRFHEGSHDVIVRERYLLRTTKLASDQNNNAENRANKLRM